MYEENNYIPTVGIKIGDGKTVFKELPVLSNLSYIHPDWNETDTQYGLYLKV